MATMQGIEQTTLEGGPALQSLGQPGTLNSHLWKGLQEKFLKGEPKVLGVVQIMIAMITLSLGIIMMRIIFLSPYGQCLPAEILMYTLGVLVMFIISGSLSVAAGIRTTKGMVRGSLGLNIISSLLAFAGMIISTIRVLCLVSDLYAAKYSQNVNSSVTMTIFMGLECMVLILNVLEFCIAVSLSAFGCKVTCCNPGVVVIMHPNPHVSETASPAPFREV